MTHTYVRTALAAERRAALLVFDLLIYVERLPEWNAQIRHVIEHRSRTDDGNASHADWIWPLDHTTGGSTLTVTWDGFAKSFWRQLIASTRPSKLVCAETSADHEYAKALKHDARP